MWDSLTRCFGTMAVMLPVERGFGSPWYLTAHAMADLAIFGAFLLIAGVLVFIALRRRALPFPWLLWMVAAVVLVCGVAHLVSALVLWWPAYPLEGVVKLVAAVVCWASAIILVLLVPRVLTLKTIDKAREEATELRRAEVALMESEAIYASLVDSLPLNMFRKDLQGRLVFANKRYCDLLDTDLEQLM